MASLLFVVAVIDGRCLCCLLLSGVAWCVLFVVCCLLFEICCLGGCCSLCVVRCVLFDRVCRYVACVVCCLLFGVLRVLLLVY